LYFNYIIYQGKTKTDESLLPNHKEKTFLERYSIENSILNRKKIINPEAM